MNLGRAYQVGVCQRLKILGQKFKPGGHLEPGGCRQGHVIAFRPGSFALLVGQPEPDVPPRGGGGLPLVSGEWCL